MLGLAYERRFTGYGDLTPALAHAATAARLTTKAPEFQRSAWRMQLETVA